MSFSSLIGYFVAIRITRMCLQASVLLPSERLLFDNTVCYNCKKLHIFYDWNNLQKVNECVGISVIQLDVLIDKE